MAISDIQQTGATALAQAQETRAKALEAKAQAEAKAKQVKEAAEKAIPAPTIATALDARYISALLDQRIKASKV
jgi:6-phosphogluconate dehydrogenase